jgi:hypothetical protein
MNSPQVHVPGSVFNRILWLFGLYTLLSNAAYLIGYHWLPEGFLRGSPVTAVAQFVANEPTFLGQFGLTLLFNLGATAVVVTVLNLLQFKGIPFGYVYLLGLGMITSGLIAGTNSFAASDITQSNVRDGMARLLSIGNLEFLGYIFIAASTVRLGIYQYRSWWSRDWKPVKVMRLREVRLATPEIVCLAMGILLIVFGAFRETVDYFSML